MGDLDARALPVGRGAVSGQSSPRYDRAPSRYLRELLAPGGFLAPLLARRTHDDGIKLELHLRARDQVHLYCGLTCLVKAGPSGNRSVWVKSHRTYGEQGWASQLIRPERATLVDRNLYLRDVWSIDEPGFSRALEAFLDGVEVDNRQRKEGEIQACWAQVREPWIVFDKEAALAYPSVEERRRFMSATFHPSVEEARNRLHALARSMRSLPNRRQHWKMPGAPKERLKLDALAVDPDGNLVLLEVKDASGSPGEVYYSPFQLLQNVWEWHHALKSVHKSVQDLLDARVELRLTPGDVPRITGSLRAAVGFGEDERSDEVRHRYTKVLGIVNSLLPPEVLSIETWALVNGEPVRLV